MATKALFKWPERPSESDEWEWAPRPGFPQGQWQLKGWAATKSENEEMWAEEEKEETEPRRPLLVFPAEDPPPDCHDGLKYKGRYVVVDGMCVPVQEPEAPRLRRQSAAVVIVAVSLSLQHWGGRKTCSFSSFAMLEGSQQL